MSNNVNQQSTKPAGLRWLFSVALVLGCALLTVTGAAAQNVAVPVVPTDIAVPTGNTAFLVGHAFGSQGYTCLPTSNGGTAWNPNARPEATLFIKIFGRLQQIITHFASVNTNPIDPTNAPPLSGNATWQSSFDSSKVWAVKTGQIKPGSDDSCPNSDSIACLRLQSVGNQVGPAGGKTLANVSFVLRLNTKGGAAPTTDCVTGQTQLQPYEADYYFFRPEE